MEIPIFSSLSEFFLDSLFFPEKQFRADSECDLATVCFGNKGSTGGWKDDVTKPDRSGKDPGVATWSSGTCRAGGKATWCGGRSYCSYSVARYQFPNAITWEEDEKYWHHINTKWWDGLWGYFCAQYLLVSFPNCNKIILHFLILDSILHDVENCHLLLKLDLNYTNVLIYKEEKYWHHINTKRRGGWLFLHKIFACFFFKLQ